MKFFSKGISILFIILFSLTCKSVQEKEICDQINCANSLCITKMEAISKQFNAENPNESYSIYLIDQSGSMYAQFGSSNRMETAKNITIDFIKQLNPKSDKAKNFGLYTFGGYGCNCIHEIQSPFLEFNKDELISRVKNIQPKGLTPISNSLDVMTAFLKDKKGKYHVNLITDGMESCGGNPELSAERLQSLANARMNLVTIEIIIAGIDMSPSEEVALNKIAISGGGKYVSIKNEESLKRVFDSTQISIPSQPSSYFELSAKEFKDQIYGNKSSSCSYSNIPAEIIERCEKDHVMIRQNTRREKDVFHFYLLNSPSYHSRKLAYIYFKENNSPNLRAANEILNDRLNTEAIRNLEDKLIVQTIGSEEKKLIQETLDGIKQ